MQYAPNRKITEYREHDEKAQEEAERGSALQISSPGKKVARKLGAETLLALRFDAPLAISNPLACWVILARPGSECKCMHSGICLVDADKCTVSTRLLHVG